MNSDNISFNALIVGSTNWGKKKHLVNILSTTFRGKFDYIVLFRPTFIHDKTYNGFGENDRNLLILTPLQDQIHNAQDYQLFAWGNKHTDHSRWLRCCERCETEDEWTHEFSLQRKTKGNHRLGPHTTDDKHCKTIQRALLYLFSSTHHLPRI